MIETPMACQTVPSSSLVPETFQLLSCRLPSIIACFIIDDNKQW